MKIDNQSKIFNLSKKTIENIGRLDLTIKLLKQGYSVYLPYNKSDNNISILYTNKKFYKIYTIIADCKNENQVEFTIPQDVLKGINYLNLYNQYDDKLFVVNTENINNKIIIKYDKDDIIIESGKSILCDIMRIN